MATLKDYLSENDLQRVQNAFSVVAGQPVGICSADGRPLPPPTDRPAEDKSPPESKPTQRLKRPKRRRPDRESLISQYIPVLLGGEVVGRVRLMSEADSSAESPAAEPFQTSLLQLMAGVLTHLCEGAIQLRSRIKQLLALHRVTEEITGVRDLQQVLDAVTQTVVDAMRVKACSIRLLNEDDSELVIRAVHSISPQYLDKRPIPLSDSQLDREVLESDQPVYVADMTTDPRVIYRAEAKREGLVSGLCAPMVFKGRREGVLRAFTGRRHEFDWFDRQLLQTIANSAGAAIANARLYEEAAQSWQIKRQLALGGEVQRRMIPPRSPSAEGFDIYAAYIPSQELAGDFYDFIKLPRENLGLAVCDVAGKGVRASLLMASIRASLRAHAVNVYDMSDVLGRVNRDLCADTLSSDFATMFYGVLDTKAKRLTYTSAGHLPPFLVRNGAVSCLETRGGVLGVLPEMEYPLENFELLPGDVILAYTDGLNEAINFQGEPYGCERIEQALLYATAENYSAEGIVRYCLWDLRRFAGLHRRNDDRTLLAIKAL